MSGAGQVDLAVLAPDPRFGGGGRALTTAFVETATELGRAPRVFSRPHPGLDEGRRHRSIDALYQLRGARALAPSVRGAASLWVVAPTAPTGGAAPRTRRPYACWLAASVDGEWHGRAPGLSIAHRLAAATSLPVLRRLEQSVLRNAACVYATSAASRDAIAYAIDHSMSVGLLPVPVDTARFFPEPDEVWAERLAEPMLAFVGRADDPRKNVQLLLDAFALVRRTVPKARLRLIGRPPRPGIHLGAGVEAVGEVDDLPSVLRSAHLFVLPSRQEGFGIVVAEALAAGVPVVTTPSGGPERLVHESGGGRVTETFEPDELAAAIVRLVTSPAELEGCRRSGRSYVIAHHAPDVFAALLSAAMRELDAVGRRSSA